MCAMDDREAAPNDVPGARVGETWVDFEGFYASTWHAAARWATALVGDVATGEEVAQESFLLVADRFTALDSPAAYLRRTIVNTARMHARSAGRRVARERLLAMPDTTGVPDGDATIDGALLAVLVDLPYDRRAAVVLRYWADWTDDSIADALGCRPSTVRSHLRRGLRDLRSGLSDGDRT